MLIQATIQRFIKICAYMWLVSSEELWLREIVQMAPSLYDKSGAGAGLALNIPLTVVWSHLSTYQPDFW